MLLCAVVEQIRLFIDFHGTRPVKPSPRKTKRWKEGLKVYVIISSFSLVFWKTGAAGPLQLCILVIEIGLSNARDLQGKSHIIFYLYSAVSISTASVIVDTLEFGKRWIPSPLLLCTKCSCCPVFYPPAIASVGQ